MKLDTCRVLELPVAILRRPSCLWLREVCRVHPSAADTPADLLLEVRERPLPARNRGVFQRNAALRQAWERLGSVAQLDAGTLADILLILLGTVPGGGAEHMAMPLLQAPASSVHATAAHPRAFKGTKHKPPKSGSGPPCDLRPALCDRRHGQRLLASGWTKRRDALPHLAGVGLDPDGLDRLMRLREAPRNPALIVHHADAPIDADLPSGFLEWLHPALRGQSWSLVRRAARLYAQLGLDTAPHLAGFAAAILTTAPQRGLDWLDTVVPFSSAARSLILSLVLATEAGQCTSPVEYGEAWEALREVPAERLESWCRTLLTAMRDGVNPVYIASGLRLASRFALHRHFYEVHSGEDFAAKHADRIVGILADTPEPGDAFDLWAACGRVPGILDVLAAEGWTDLSPKARHTYASFLMHLQYHDDEFTTKHWRALREYLPQIEQGMRAVSPAYVSQFLNNLGELITSMSPSDMREYLPTAIEILEQVNRPPFDRDGSSVYALGNLLRLPAELRARLRDTPTSSYLRLDKQARRSNDGHLIAWGLLALVRYLPKDTLATFRNAPGALCRIAKLLGSFSGAMRKRLVQKGMTAPIFRLSDPDPIGLCGAIDASLPRAPTNVIPRAVREYAAGRRSLSSVQIAQHMAHVRGHLAEVRLHAIESVVLDHLERQASGPLSPGLREALLLLQEAEENRRGLRRALQAYLAGDDDYIHNHPATRLWARRHHQIDLNLWRRGLAQESSASGAFHLAVEQDSLEILKLGTYVGSCLGRGGPCTYSAAAALLDANKRVIYARTPKGVVLARQLVALSDEGTLVPFTVYPEVGPDLQRAFAEYDRAWAKKLGVRITRPDERYTIAQILSQAWWDDGVWDDVSRPRRTKQASGTRRQAAIAARSREA